MEPLMRFRKVTVVDAIEQEFCAYRKQDNVSIIALQATPENCPQLLVQRSPMALKSPTLMSTV